MLSFLQIATILLVAIAMALSLAHALEFPGKLRLSKENYLAVQPIYYPGFTIAGVAEPLGIVALIALSLTTTDRVTFWLMLMALAALIASHAVYWLMTHPVNNFWLTKSQLGGAGKALFGTAAGDVRKDDWQALRDRWEWSHIVRAVLSMLSFILLLAATID